MGKKLVVIGLIGTTLDVGKTRQRWDRWRPSVSICQHEDLVIDRFELLVDERYMALARTVSEDIGSVSPETELRINRLEQPDPWDFEKVFAALYDFARAYPFDLEKEDYLVHITTGSHVAQICLFLLTESRHFPARLIQSSPGAQGRRSSVGTYSIVDLDLSRYDMIATRFREDRREGEALLKGGIATRNKAFNAMIADLERVALASKAPVLLEGPTGAGKTRLAHRLYELRKGRRLVDGPFVQVNCATLRGEGAMSTLFGHRRGAFTGALEARKGLLLAAHRGLLFLDEIGELGLDEQAMLLRAIEEKRFLPLGADQEVTSDFQLVAGTNRDLTRDVRSGRFREDLLARINLWTFRLPGLAERREDIEPNLDHELDRFAAEQGTRVTMNREARSRFIRFATSPEAAWNGNFRDLYAAVTRMATLSTNGRITESVVDAEIARLRGAWAPGDGAEGGFVARFLSPADRERIDLFDLLQLEQVLAVCVECRSMSDAGRRLFQASRQTKASSNDADRLRKYLARFGLEWKDLATYQPGS
ncbi:AAA family ATPase [bacterium]|nr:AAA family ATPase [bacterium]